MAKRFGGGGYVFREEIQEKEIARILSQILPQAAMTYLLLHGEMPITIDEVSSVIGEKIESHWTMEITDFVNEYLLELQREYVAQNSPQD